MKKVFYLVAIATFALLSCQKEIETETTQPAKAAFTASIENLASPTKADIDNTNNLVWKTGDKIGIYVDESSWEDKNQPFHLSSGEDSYLGGFDWDYSGWSDANNVTAAFFPWQGTGSGNNNVSGGTMYFKLRDAYYDYTPGQMLTPLVAPLTKGVSSISFKHAGAAVKVTINNLPKGVHSIGMTVDGQQVSGDYHIDPANAGLDALELDNPADVSKNSVWLNFNPTTAEGAYTFLFPVPTLTAPKLSFQIYDDNGILVWTANLKAQADDLGRAEVLVMPDKDITPYKQFNKKSENWTVIGTYNDTNWDADVPMVTDGNLCIAKGLTFAAGGKFKVRKDSAWDESYGNGNDDYYVATAGTYDVIFNETTKAITLSNSDAFQYPGLPPVPKLERVWGWYSGDALWTSNTTAFSITHPDNYGMARGLAMDDSYIYLPKSSAYAAVGAVNILDPSTQVKGSVSGISGGTTFVTSFARMIKNTDTSVNNGKDVLLVCNLTETNSDADKLVVYAYTNGITNAPVTLCVFAYDSANSTYDWRRYGDRFFVTGTWQQGKLYFPSFYSPKTVVLTVENGVRTAVTQIHGGDYSPNGIKDITVYPGGNKLFLTNGSIANQLALTGGKNNNWEATSLVNTSTNGVGTWGYNFFEFNGKKYIAYARINGEKAWIEVIEDQGTEDAFLASIEAQAGMLKAPIHSATDLDAEHATGGVADCCVRIIEGVPYIAALTRDGGMVVYKMILVSE